MKNDFFDFVESERFASRLGDGTISGLDNHVANVRAMAEEIGYKNGNDDLTDKIVFGNEAADLQGTRDHMIKLYREGRFSDLLTWASTTYHKDILEYLPKEVRAFIEKNIA